ncbi:MAG: DUF1015 domain-containing protein [Candidatus Faecivicinus sp.]
MNTALKKARILLPAANVENEKWAVVACDQFTAQPEYWAQADALVGDAPSTLRLTLPEVYLSERESRTPAIHAAMRDYLDRGALTEAVNGFLLVERITPSGVRPGLMVALDLNCYDYAAGSTSLIRATEGTVPSRVPPRAKIRAGAPLELPHVMMLIDDPGKTVIEPLYARRGALRPLYDFELMLGGGHLRGWAVENEDADGVFSAVEGLAERCDGLLYAVGDGNHSLAAAKQCWMQLREQLSEAERESHPARYALVELVNLNCPALVFEPIHRVLFNVDSEDLLQKLRACLNENGVSEGEGGDLIVFDRERELSFRMAQHPLPVLQPFLDGYLAEHPEVEIDYIHGDAALRELVANHPRSMGFMPRAFDKAELFGAIRRWGALPRKTFSMGEATEKRYYMEARKIL